MKDGTGGDPESQSPEDGAGESRADDTPLTAAQIITSSAFVVALLGLLLWGGCSCVKYVSHKMGERQEARQAEDADPKPGRSGRVDAGGKEERADTPPPAGTVTPENYRRIRRGMTEREVEAILGPGRLTFNRSGQTSNSEVYRCKEWKGHSGGTVWVEFVQGVVSDVEMYGTLR